MSVGFGVSVGTILFFWQVNRLQDPLQQVDPVRQNAPIPEQLEVVGVGLLSGAGVWVGATHVQLLSSLALSCLLINPEQQESLQAKLPPT
jgi:hypothetical protein